MLEEVVVLDEILPTALSLDVLLPSLSLTKIEILGKGQCLLITNYTAIIHRCYVIHSHYMLPYSQENEVAQLVGAPVL